MPTPAPNRIVHIRLATLLTGLLLVGLLTLLSSYLLPWLEPSSATILRRGLLLWALAVLALPCLPWFSRLFRSESARLAVLGRYLQIALLLLLLAALLSSLLSSVLRLPSGYRREGLLVLWTSGMILVLRTLLDVFGSGVDVSLGYLLRTLLRYLLYFGGLASLSILGASLAFVLFPAALLLHVLSGIHLLLLWLAEAQLETAFLCVSLQRVPSLAHWPCRLVLLGFHLGHPLLLALLLRYFHRLADAVIAGFKVLLTSLEPATSEQSSQSS